MKSNTREIIDPHKTADYDPHFVMRVERLKRTFRPAVLRRTIGEIPAFSIQELDRKSIPAK